MTLHSVLIEIASARAKGIGRETLIERYGWNVMHEIEHLVQLRLILSSDLPYWQDTRYFVSCERGHYIKSGVAA